MKPADEIRRLIHESQIATGPKADERLLHGARDELAKRQQGTTGRPEPALWRTIMNNKLTKLTAAAAFVIALFLGHTLIFSTGSSVTWAQAIEPILTASTAEFDIVIGAEDSGTPIIHDMVMGSRIRRTAAGLDDSVAIIDLETSRILSFSETKKEARYVSLEGLPSIPNYMEHLKSVIVMLQESPEFVIEDLGVQQIDGREVVGFLAKHPRAEITLWADAETGLPVRIEQNEGQMRTTCKNMEFDVPMGEELFSMEVPEGYTLHEETTLDLQAGTEEAFIEGLRLVAETFNDGRFPEGVAVEDYLKQAPDVAKQIESMNLNSAEETALGQTIQNYLLFTRFFRGEGPWTYRGQGVMLGEAETPIFWYRPKDSATYRVIYGDLHVEDVAPGDLPEPLSADELAEIRVGYQTWSQPDFVGTQEDYWYVLPDGRARVKAYLTLVKGPEETSLLPIQLPYADAPLEALLLEREPLVFHKTGAGAYNIELPLDKLLAGQTKIICQWHLSLEDLKKAPDDYRTVLQSLIPVTSYKLKVGVDPQSSFELTKETSGIWITPFTRGPAKPAAKFGSCGLMLEER
jgi:hypothetical protein